MRLRPSQVAVMAQDHSAHTLAEAFAPRYLTVERTSTPDVVRLRDPDGATAVIGLDDHGRIGSYRYPSGRQLLLGYSDSHHLTQVQLPSGSRTSLEYDDRGRLLATDRDGLQWRLQYSTTERLAGVSYPDGTRETFDRDSRGEVVATIDRNGHATRFVRDESGRLVQLVDANGNVTTFQYGDWTQPDLVIRPDGISEMLFRDAAGLPSEVQFDGATVATVKFDGERLSELRYADGECLEFTYDGEGQYLHARSNEVSVVRAYDDQGRLIREQINDQVVEMTYAFDGHPQSITTDEGRASFEYDGDRRLTAVEDWHGGRQRYEYDKADGRVIRTLPGLREETLLTPGGLVAQVVTHAVSGEVLQMWQQYGRDANDRVIAANDSHLGQINYAYDGEGQLVSAVSIGSEQHFAYDPVGNRLNVSGIGAAFNEGNQVIVTAAERMLYDNRGNLVSRQNADGATAYVFSSRNLLKAVIRRDGTQIEFGYDAFGRRVTKRVGDVTTRYMWFGNHLLYEWTDGRPETRRDYLYKPGTHEALAMRQNGAVYYFHNTHDGAPRRLTDVAGQVVWMAQYDAFGQLLRQEGALSQPLRFAGQYADEETGLHYNLARYYSPELGRYISRDPLGFVSGPNAYLYCFNDPINGRDPTGLLSGFWKCAAAVALVAVGVAAIVVAGPVILAAAAAVAAGGAVAVGATAGAVALTMVGAGAVGAGVGLAIAPDGCAACQKKMMWDMGIAFAGGALSVVSAIIFPPLAGGGALALAGGGALGGGSALGLAGVAAGALGILGAGIHAMSGEPGRQTPEEEEAAAKKKADDEEASRQRKLGEDPARGGKHLPNEEKTAVRLEKQQGTKLERFKPGKGEKGDWVDPKTGEVYDGCSPAESTYFDKNFKDYPASMQKHLTHPTVDKVVVDVTDLNLTPAQQTQLTNYLDGLSAAEQAKIVRIGF